MENQPFSDFILWIHDGDVSYSVHMFEEQLDTHSGNRNSPLLLIIKSSLTPYEILGQVRTDTQREWIWYFTISPADYAGILFDYFYGYEGGGIVYTDGPGYEKHSYIDGANLVYDGTYVKKREAQPRENLKIGLIC